MVIYIFFLLSRVNRYRKLKYTIFLQRLQIFQFYCYNYPSNISHTKASDFLSQCISYETKSMQLYCYCFKTMHPLV